MPQGPVKNQSLVLRLVRGATMWALPILLLTAITLTWLYRNTTYRSFDDPLVSAVTALIATADVKDNELTLTREPLDPRYQRALSGRYWLVGFLQDDGVVEPISASRSLLEATLVLPSGAVKDLQAQQGEEVRARIDGPDTNETLRSLVSGPSMRARTSSPC